MGCAQPVNYPVRVAVVDGSPMNAYLLSEAIGRDRNLLVVAFTAESRQITSLVLKHLPDVVLLSVTLDEKPDRGFAALAELRLQSSGPKVIMLLDSSKQDSVVKAFRYGARGVFCRNSPIKTLCKCIHVVHSGQIWANTEELGYLVAALAAATETHHVDPKRFSLLSEREHDVVGCLAQGLSNREIAQLLRISPHTVKNYMFRIFEKLGVSSRVELLFYVMSRNAPLAPKENPSTSGQPLRPLKKSVVAIPASLSSGGFNRRAGDPLVLDA